MNPMILLNNGDGGEGGGVDPDNSDPDSNDSDSWEPDQVKDDITKHPLYTEHFEQLSKGLESKITGRILKKEAKVKSFKELDELISLGRKAKEGNNSDDSDPNVNKELLQEKEEWESKYNEVTNRLKGEKLTGVIKEEFIKAGGLDNDNTIKQVIKLITADEDLEIDDELNITTKTGISVKKYFEKWVNSNPHFKKDDIKAPGRAPGKSRASGGDNRNVNLRTGLSQFLK